MVDSLAADVWNRLEVFEVGGEGDSSFVRRLSGQQGWDRAFALRAILEYKRFLLLKIVDGGCVIPSQVVDEVWHLHLQYTEDYWGRLCRNLVGRDLHHTPRSVSRVSLAEFLHQYARTLERYREQFGTEPPEDIWPPVQERLGPNFDRTVERTLQFSARFLVSLAVFYLLFRQLTPPPELTAFAFVGAMASVLLVHSFVLAHWLKTQLKPLNGLDDLQPFELACLFRGDDAVTFALVVSLILHGRANIVEETKIGSGAPVPADASEWERLAGKALASGPKGLDELALTLAPLTTRTHEKAIVMGLDVPQAVRRKAFRMSAPILYAAPISAALAWRGNAPDAEGPMIGGLLVCVVLFTMFMKVDQLTQLKRFRNDLMARFADLNLEKRNASRTVGETVLAVCVFGGLALKGTPLWDRLKLVNQDRITAESCG